ncbi:hypothetical protein Avbf_00461 [Armadillidium vulgare]|nr:hypothetical protein Avbf_00461 [Armadillidium vulgare]
MYVPVYYITYVSVEGTYSHLSEFFCCEGLFVNLFVYRNSYSGSSSNNLLKNRYISRIVLHKYEDFIRDRDSPLECPIWKDQRILVIGKFTINDQTDSVAITAVKIDKVDEPRNIISEPSTSDAIYTSNTCLRGQEVVQELLDNREKISHTYQDVKQNKHLKTTTVN